MITPISRWFMMLMTIVAIAGQPVFAATKASKPKVTLNYTKAQEIGPGGSVELIATATNATDYQWYNGKQPISGAISANYVVTADGSYFCQVKGAGGTVKSKAVKVTLFLAPASLAGKTIVASASYRIRGKATGLGRYDETTEAIEIFKISEDGKTLYQVNETGTPIDGLPSYSITYKRQGPKNGEVGFKSSAPLSRQLLYSLLPAEFVDSYLPYEYFIEGNLNYNFKFKFTISSYNPVTSEISGVYSGTGTHKLAAEVYEYDEYLGKISMSGINTAESGGFIFSD